MPRRADPMAAPGGGEAAAPAARGGAALPRRALHLPAPGQGPARPLLWTALAGAVALLLWLLWLQELAGAPHWPAVWRLAEGGAVELDRAGDPALRPALGQRLTALVPAQGPALAADASLLPHAPRWIVRDAQRGHWLATQQRLADWTHQGALTLRFEPAGDIALAPRPRSLAGLGVVCWAISALALGLVLAAAVVLTTRPGAPALLYALLALAQAASLLIIGAESLPGTGLPAALVQYGLPARLLADAVAAAALVHMVMLYPRRLAHAPALALTVWTVALGAAAWLVWRAPAGLWWQAQALMLAGGVLAARLLGRSTHRPPSPLARQQQRLVLAGTGTLLLLSLAVATPGAAGVAQYRLAAIGSVVWSVFFASLLILGPFLSTSRRLLREFTLLAGVSTVSLSLGLLSLNVLELEPTTSLLLVLATSLAGYGLARPWLLEPRGRRGALSGERLFDSLYRVARELEQSPERADRLLATLLQEVFDPKEVARSSRPAHRIRVAADGSTLVVPVAPLLGVEADAPGTGAVRRAVVLRHADRGRRLFTPEDGQLCERLIEQLRRAVAYDRAVEQGRSEERTRIAQDLHDDIGARLLTLMYKAQDPDIEEYIRHTLQDLKTLTRGLAASSHRLSHAAAEWKADITQRLSLAGCELQWNFSIDRDMTLSVVQWSGLTRVLRELVNNIITHARAGQVEIAAQLEQGRLQLQVSDDGIGRAPATWSHGLGLGGVRKRVKLLGGQVQWLERDGGGIRCELRIPLVGDSL